MHALTRTSGDPDLIQDRIAACDWPKLDHQLDEHGFAVLENLVPSNDCQDLRSIYAADDRFRKRVIMQRHGYGRGEYKYFDYPLPEPIAALRTHLYPRLAVTANRWHEQMKIDTRFPATHAEFIDRCRAAGQQRATPLLLRYGPQDYNCLHQDLYGEHVFPLQVALLLSQPDTEFSGGEFVLTEQRPRMQSRPMVVPLRQGDAVVFGVHHRPVRGSRGFYRVTMRHGVSALRSGERFTAGIIFHDART